MVDSLRRSWRHDSGDEQILERATSSQNEAIRQARIAIGRAGQNSQQAEQAIQAAQAVDRAAQAAETVPLTRSVSPTRLMPTSSTQPQVASSNDARPEATQEAAQTEIAQTATIQAAATQVNQPEVTHVAQSETDSGQSFDPEVGESESAFTMPTSTQSSAQAPTQLNQPVATPVVVNPQESNQPEASAIKPQKITYAGPIPISIFFCLLIGLLAATLPFVAAITASLLVWIAAARGHSVLHQYEREQQRGGFRRHGDGVKEAIRTPLYLVQALPLAIGTFALFFAFDVLADLLAIGLFSLPSTPLVISLFNQTISLPLIAGSGISWSALFLGIATVGALAIVFFHGPRTRPIRLGLSVMWLAMRRGMSRIVGRDCSLVDPLWTGGAANGVTYPAGYEAYGGDVGYGSPQDVHQRQHGGEIIGIILLVVCLAALVVSAIHLSVPIDWTPLVTGIDR